MRFQNIIYVILKDQNGTLTLDKKSVIFGYYGTTYLSIQGCQCGSNICNIKGDMSQKVGPAMLEYF